MKLVIVTIGFDEKLPLRGLLKFGLDVNDVVLSVYSMTGGKWDVEKVERAVKAFKDIVTATGVKVADLVVSGSDFYNDTLLILNALKEYQAEEIIAVLAGGMRIIIFEVMTALLLRHRLKGVKAKVYIAREDGLYDITLPTEIFYVNASSGDHAILRILSERGTVRRSLLVEEVSREKGLSWSMVYKLIKSLARRKLIALEDDSVKMTELGQLAYSASQ